MSPKELAPIHTQVLAAPDCSAVEVVVSVVAGSALADSAGGAAVAKLHLWRARAQSADFGEHWPCRHGATRIQRLRSGARAWAVNRAEGEDGKVVSSAAQLGGTTGVLRMALHPCAVGELSCGVGRHRGPSPTVLTPRQTQRASACLEHTTPSVAASLRQVRLACGISPILVNVGGCSRQFLSPSRSGGAIGRMGTWGPGSEQACLNIMC